MTRVLIIARSPLAEQELECTLQRSFDEVFCSSELMKEVEKYSLVTQYFSVVILVIQSPPVKWPHTYHILRNWACLFCEKDRKNN